MFASKSALSERSRSAMAAATLSTRPVSTCGSPINCTRRDHPRGSRQLGLFEIPLHPQRCAIHQRHHRLAGAHIVAGLQPNIGDRAVDRADHGRALEIEGGHGAVGHRLTIRRRRRLGTVCRCSCVSCETESSVSRSLRANSRAASSICALRLATAASACARASSKRSGSMRKSTSPRFTGWLSFTRDLGHQPGDIRRDRHHVRGDATVPRPWLLLIVNPQAASRDQRDDDDQERQRGAGSDVNKPAQNGFMVRSTAAQRRRQPPE